MDDDSDRLERGVLNITRVSRDDVSRLSRVIGMEWWNSGMTFDPIQFAN